MLKIDINSSINLIDNNSTSFLIQKIFHDLSIFFKIKDISFQFSNENKDKKDQSWNELKNPYLKIDDIPEIERIDKNKIMFCDKKEYNIKEYIEKINDSFNDFLDDDMYNYCGKCNKYLNKFFCFICCNNICEECYKECNINNHSLKNLEEFNYKNNINKINSILNNLIIPIMEDEKIIKDIIEYIEKYIINNDKNYSKN